MFSLFSAGEGIPAWILPPILLCALILAGWSYGIHKSPGRKRYLVPAVFRAGTFVVLTLLLLDLVFSWTLVRLRKPVVKVFLDNSVSAAYHQSISGSSLMNGYSEIASVLREAASENPSNARVDVYSFGSEVDTILSEDFKLDFSEPTTHLSKVFRRLENIPPDEFVAAAVVVTDGQITMGGDPTVLAVDLGIPVHTVGIGELTPMVDVHVEKVDVPTVAVRGDTPTATVFLSSVGQFRERVHLTLSRGETLLGSKVVTLEGRGSVRREKFPFRLEAPGLQEYTVQVSSLKDEINIENNRASFLITTLKDRFRVALLTGTPSPNTRFLKLVLGRSERFETDHFVRLGNGWTPQLVTFWGTNYDLIILDNLGKNSLPGPWIDDFARKLDRFPSALAFVTGPNVTQEDLSAFYPLLGLVPMAGEVDRERPHGVSLSEERFRHPVFSAPTLWGVGSPAPGSLPPLRPSVLAKPGSPGMLILAHLDGNEGIPLFILGTVRLPEPSKNAIRALTFASADLWQLYFRTQLTAVSDFVQRWWERSLNWLVKSGGEDEIYARLNKSTYQQGETIHVSATVLDLGQFPSQNLDVSFLLENRELQEVRSYSLDFDESRGWETTLFASRPGIYDWAIEAGSTGRVIGRQTGTFRVEESQIELNRVFLNQKLLEDLSQSTGGTYLPWALRLEVADHVSFPQRSIRTAQSFHLSHWLPLGILLVIFLTGEWVSRRLVGLQ